ncbi:SLBB domain-containing protein [Rubrivirga sp. IMCC45206]|uniref:SLBB domain-containing protein n=1 Tax=Rubrivirga sp. IMCC45206 TaxID=3391614 RepID=UPI00398FB6F2
MPLPVRGIVLPVLAAVCCLCASPDVAAQYIPPAASTARVPTLSGAARTARPTEDVVLAGPVDAETYLVGPGDVFVVSVGGGSVGVPPRQTEAVVSADGLLVIAEAGTFRAAGRTLAAVRADAAAALSRQYRNVPTDVALVAPRRFAVYVSGAVPLPGRQTVTALGRVEDAIAATTGELNPLALADYETPTRFEVERRVALRNVTVTDQDGAVRRVDLFRYYATGDLAYNPRLVDGAAVFVPTFDPVREGVAVAGDVERPGTYDWRPDDTAAALVAVAGGPGLDLADASVRRTRVVGGQPQSVVVSLAEARTLDVAPRDQISVVAAAPDAGYASAVGAVAFPGTYPIVSGQTTLTALVEAAGGLTDQALLRGAYLERTARTEPQAALDPLAYPTDRPVTIAMFDSTVTSLGRLSDLGLVGRRYYVQEYVSTPRLSVDVPAALAGSLDLRLRDGDRLVVPRDLGVVRVFGQVSSPGYVPYDPGLTAGEYLARAGGPGPAGTTVYTVDARTGRFTAGPETLVQPGDAVFVDRPPTSDSPEFENLAIQEQREEREAARDRRQFLFQTITTTVTTLGFLIGTYFTATRN